MVVFASIQTNKGLCVSTGEASGRANKAAQLFFGRKSGSDTAACNLNSGKNSSVGRRLPPSLNLRLRNRAVEQSWGIWKRLNPWEILASKQATDKDQNINANHDDD